MPSYINTNTLSLNSQLQLNKSQNSMQTAMERLSSGLRINSAKDDPAGLAIASRMGSQIKGMNQAASNANNAISLTQTADGALGQINDMLSTLRQLAVQSSDATNTASDRASLQATAGKLVEQINNIATGTEFNGMKLLDGSFKDQKFQVGANAGQTLAISINGAKTSQLGTNDTAALTAQGTGNSIASGDLYINGVAIRSSSSGDDLASYPASSKAASAIAKAAAINASSDKTGVTATADVNVSQGAFMTSGQVVKDGSLSINGIKLTVSTTGDTASDRASIADAINSIQGQTGVVAKDTGDDQTGISLTAADGRNITVQFGGGLDASNTGVRGLAANTLVGAEMTSTAAGTGSITINGVSTETIATASDKATTRNNVVSAINAISDKTGVIAVNTGDDTQGIELQALDGRKITTSFNTVTGTFGESNTGVSDSQDISTIATTGVASAAAISNQTGKTLVINGETLTLDLTGAATNGGSNTTTAVANTINANTTLTSMGITAKVDSSTGAFTINSSKGAAIDMEPGTADLSKIFNSSEFVTDVSSTQVLQTKATVGLAGAAATNENGKTLEINGQTITLENIGSTSVPANVKQIASLINQNANLTSLGIRANADQVTGEFSLISTKGEAIDMGGTANLSNLFKSSGYITDTSAEVVSTGTTAGPAAASATISNQNGNTLVINGETIKLDLTAAAVTNGGSNTTAAIASQINANETLTALGIRANVDDTTGAFSLISTKGNAIDVDEVTGTAVLSTLFATPSAYQDVDAPTPPATGVASTAEGTDYGSYTLSSTDKIEVTTGGGATASLANAGLASGSYSAQTAYTTATENNGLAMKKDDVRVNGVSIGASQSSSDTFSAYSSAVSTSEAKEMTAASAISKAAAFNAVSDQTGVTATVNATEVKGTSMTQGLAGTGTLTINGVTTGSIGVADVASAGTDQNRLAAQNRTAIVNAINAISTQTGVVATDSNDIAQGIQLTAADGRNVNLQFNNGLNSDNTGLGVKENVGAQTLDGSGANITAAAAAGTLDINGTTVNITVTAANADTSGKAVEDAINAVKDKTGVTATYEAGKGVSLSSVDGVGFTVGKLTGTLTAANTGLNADLATQSKEITAKSSTSFGTFTLSSNASFNVDKGTTATLENTGLTVGEFGSGKSGMSLDRLDISTAAGATAAITAIDNAMKQIDENRSNLGATQNGLNANITNLQTTSTNLAASQSRIQDADFATETANLSRAKILQQAGTAMLAQANASNQGVLSLLQ